MSELQGRRLDDGDYTGLPVEPGDYWRAPDGRIHYCDPQGHRGQLTTHGTAEAEDGALTVNEPIRDAATYNENRVPGWSGHLRGGTWIAEQEVETIQHWLAETRNKFVDREEVMADLMHLWPAAEAWAAEREDREPRA